MVKDGDNVGHRPQLFSKTCSLMLSGCSMRECVTGKPKKQRGNGLKISWIVTIKFSEHVYVKVGTIIKDLCGRLVWEEGVFIGT